MPNQRQSIHAFCVFCGGFPGGIGFVGVACKGVGTGFGGGNAGYAEPAGAAQSEGILTVFADIRQAVCAAPFGVRLNAIADNVSRGGLIQLADLLPQRLGAHMVHHPVAGNVIPGFQHVDAADDPHAGAQAGKAAAECFAVQLCQAGGAGGSQQSKHTVGGAGIVVMAADHGKVCPQRPGQQNQRPQQVSFYSILPGKAEQQKQNRKGKQQGQGIVFEHIQAGKKAGEAVEKLCKDESNIYIGIVSSGENTENNTERQQGFAEYIETLGNAKIVDTVYISSDADNATEETKKLLKKHPEINALIGFNEWATLGAGTAISELDLADSVCVVGFDSNIKCVGMLEVGEIDTLIVQNPFAIGYIAVSNAAQLMAGKSIDPLTETSVYVVNRSNMFNKDVQKVLFSFE